MRKCITENISQNILSYALKDCYMDFQTPSSGRVALLLLATTLIHGNNVC